MRQSSHINNTGLYEIDKTLKFITTLGIPLEQKFLGIVFFSFSLLYI